MLIFASLPSLRLICERFWNEGTCLERFAIKKPSMRHFFLFSLPFYGWGCSTTHIILLQLFLSQNISLFLPHAFISPEITYICLSFGLPLPRFPFPFISLISWTTSSIFLHAQTECYYSFFWLLSNFFFYIHPTHRQICLDICVTTTLPKTSRSPFRINNRKLCRTSK